MINILALGGLVVQICNAIKTSKEDRWWATYNAALMGILTHTTGAGKAYEKAVQHADKAHGELKS